MRPILNSPPRREGALPLFCAEMVAPPRNPRPRDRTGRRKNEDGYRYIAETDATRPPPRVFSPYVSIDRLIVAYVSYVGLPAGTRARVPTLRESERKRGLMKQSRDDEKKLPSDDH